MNLLTISNWLQKLLMNAEGYFCIDEILVMVEFCSQGGPPNGLKTLS